MIAVALALGAAIFFSAGAVLVRKSTDHQAETYHALQSSIGVPFVGSLVASLLIYPPAALVGRQVLPFVIAGLAVPVLSRTLIFLGYEKIGVARTTSINGTTPLFSAALALVTLGEGLTPQAVMGTVLTVAGIAVIAEPHRETKSWKLSGLLFPLGSALLFAIRYTLARYGLFTSPALVGSAITSGTSLIVLLLAGRLIPHRPLRSLSARAHGLLLAAGLTYTGAYWCMFGALAGERLATVVPLIHTDTLWTLLFSSRFLREKHAVTPALVWGTCLTFAGSVLIILAR